MIDIIKAEKPKVINFKKIVKVIKHSSAQIIFGQFQLPYYIKVAKIDKQDKNRSN